MSVQPRRHLVRHVLPAVLGVFLLVFGVSPAGVPAVEAAVRPVRLEAGAHTGYRFSSTGAILESKVLKLSAPATPSSDRRRTVPNRSGVWLRLTSGSLAGWEVRETLMAYVPGTVGSVAYSPAATVTFGPGRYLGYTFAADSSIATTRRGTTTSTITALASRRAVIDGRTYVLMSSGPWRGYWIPVPAPYSRSAQRIGCNVSTKVGVGSAAVYSRINTTDREVALTFDMGGRLTPALDILERLVLDRVCATIFPTGDSLQTTTGAKVMAMLRAHPELFEVANHTQNHCNLRDGGGGSACTSGPPSASFIQKELLDTETIIRAGVGRTSVPYWRPPYGAHDSRVRTAALGAGFSKTIMWDIDTIDWRATADGGPTAYSMANKVVANARTGSIVLMHLGGWHTLNALPSMVSRLRAADLQPTTISALLRAG
jgi:peptidoglycan/xylan/chitin deacetylase (PgdA/CDA1 family)